MPSGPSGSRRRRGRAGRTARSPRRSPPAASRAPCAARCSRRASRTPASVLRPGSSMRSNSRCWSCRSPCPTGSIPSSRRRGPRGRRRRGSAAACARAPGGRPRCPRRSARASSRFSGPTYSPLTDAIGAMSQAPRHSKPRTPMSAWPSAASHMRRVELVGAEQRAGDVRADVDVVAWAWAAARTCRRSSRPRSGRRASAASRRRPGAIASGEHQP